MCVCISFFVVLFCFLLCVVYIFKQDRLKKKYQPHKGSNHLFSTKKTKDVKENPFLILDYFSNSSSLISIFAWPVDYRNWENHCKHPLFTYACTSEEVKHWLFYRKYRIEVVKLNCFKIKKGGSKIFQNGHYRILGCLNISNLVNTRVPKFIKHKPHGE